MTDPHHVKEEDEDPFDRQNRIDWLDLEKIRKEKVLMVGAGAIGNEVAKNLALSGYRHLAIVDMDRVVPANVTRCVFFTPETAHKRERKVDAVENGLKKLAPDMMIETFDKKIQELGEDFFDGFDIIFGCLDNLQARLHVNAHACYKKIPYIDGAMDSFRGKVQTVLPPDSPCLECLTNETHSKIMELRFSCTGEDVTFVMPKIPAEVTTTSIVSAVMVREGLKISSRKMELVTPGVTFYDGKKGTMDSYETSVDPACPNHG